MDDPKARLEALLTELDLGLNEYMKAYLAARGQMSDDRHYLSIPDAQANAVLALQARSVPLPEVTRFRIHFLLEVHRAVEP